MKIIRLLSTLPLFRKSGTTALSEAYRKELYRSLTWSNLSRTFVFSALLFFLNGILLLRDIFVTRPTGIWETNIIYKHLFYLHVMLQAVTFLVLVCIVPLRRSFQRDSRPASVTGITFAALILVWCAIIAAWVNYPAHGQITEYIMGVLGIAAVFCFHPAMSAALFLCAQTIFMILLAVESPDPNSTGLYTNSIVFILIAWALSIISFASRKREFLNKKTIEEQTAALLAANTELQQSNHELALLNAEKNEIMQIAAHDLKNPLTSMILITDLLTAHSRNMKPEDMQKQVNMIRATAERMQGIITNILNIDAIESGKVHYEPERLDLSRIIHDATEHYRVRAALKNITIHTTIQDELFVHVDRNALFQVLDNLISNAVKYSPQGKNVMVYARVAWKNGQDRTMDKALHHMRSSVRVEVHDEGPGLTEKDQEHVFEKFARLSARPTANENSTGLGLSIVKKLVEMMNGRVWCESIPGKGTVFIVECPAENTTMVEAL